MLEIKRKEDLRLARRPFVNAAVVDSKDWDNLSYFQQDFVPDLERLVEELYLQSQMVLSAMEEAVPFCKLFVSSTGKLDAYESQHYKSTYSSTDIMVKNTSKVIIFNVRQT